MRIIQLGKKLDMREAELQERVFLQGKAQIAAQKTRMTMQEAQMAMDDAGRAFRELANKAPSKMKKVWRKWQEARMALRVHWEVQEAGWLVLETESIIRDIEFSISGVKLAIEWTLRAIRNGDGGKRNKI